MTPPRRLGTRLLATGVPLAPLLGAGLGEDWVVPRQPPRYLVASPGRGGGALLTAYDGEGRILGERWWPDGLALRARLEALHGEGLAEPPSEIPDGASSALRWLDREDESAPGS